MVDERAVVAGETEIDHPAHGQRNGQHRDGGDDEGNAGEDELAAVARQIGPQGQERAQLHALLPHLVVLPKRGIYPVYLGDVVAVQGGAHRSADDGRAVG